MYIYHFFENNPLIQDFREAVAGSHDYRMLVLTQLILIKFESLNLIVKHLSSLSSLHASPSPCSFGIHSTFYAFRLIFSIYIFISIYSRNQLKISCVLTFIFIVYFFFCHIWQLSTEEWENCICCCPFTWNWTFSIFVARMCIGICAHTGIHSHPHHIHFLSALLLEWAAKPNCMHQ